MAFSGTSGADVSFEHSGQRGFRTETLSSGSTSAKNIKYKKKIMIKKEEKAGAKKHGVYLGFGTVAPLLPQKPATRQIVQPSARNQGNREASIISRLASKCSRCARNASTSRRSNEVTRSFETVSTLLRVPAFSLPIN